MKVGGKRGILRAPRGDEAASVVKAIFGGYCRGWSVRNVLCGY